MPSAAARSNRLELERQRDLLRRQQERDQRVLAALYNISLACRDRPTLFEIFEAIHRELAAVFSFDACYIAFCDERPEYFKAALLIDEGQHSFVEEVEYGYLTGNIVRSGEPLLFRDLYSERDLSAPRVMFGQTQKFSRSWMGVPLLIGRNAVGVISLQSYQIGIYSEATLDLLQRMANVIAVALENVDLSEQQELLGNALAAQVAARTDEIAALSAISSALVVRQPLPGLLEGAIDVALGLFRLDAGNVRLLDEPRETLLLQAVRGFPEAYARATGRSALASSPIRSVVEERRPSVVERGWRVNSIGARFPDEVFPAFESMLSVPLVVGSTVLGTLSLFGFQPRSFTVHEISLAQAVANQIAVVVENTRLLDERERQIAELHALGEVSQTASSAQDLATLLRQVHDALQAFMPLDAFTMVIYDPERGVITDGISIDEGHPYNYWTDQPPPPRSLTAHILRTGLALRFADLHTELDTMPEIQTAPIGSARKSRSWLGVPLLARDGNPLGVITLQSYRPAVFALRDQTFLQSVAAQVALHVQNVRLLIQRERQIAELEAIGQIGKIVTASYNLDKMLGEIYGVLFAHNQPSVFYLLVCDPQSHVIANALFVEGGEWVPLDLIGRPVPPGSLSDWILANREPLLLHDLPNQQDELRRRGATPLPNGPANSVCSWAGVPLVARDGELIGVLAIQDYRAYCFDSGTLDFLGQVASHVSLGVQKLRLFGERERLLSEARAHADAAERQAHRMELVHRIGALLSARLDQREILEIASRELVQLFWADHTGTVLLGSDGVGYVAAEFPDSGIVGASIEVAGSPLTNALMATRRPAVISDFDNDPLAAVSREQWRALGIRSLVIVPLISRDRLFGTISLDSYHEPLIFSDEELELMMTVATSIAAAVENAQLFAAEQQQRQTADTLREVARVLSSSFDPNEVLRLVLGELQKLIAYNTASIMLLDGAQLRMVASRGRPDGDEPRGITLPLEGSGAGEVVRRRDAVLRIVGNDAGPWMRLPTSENIHAWLGVPLIARGNVLGVLNIDSRSNTTDALVFTERDIEVARTFANHAALSIENARLYQESVARVEQELEIARRIQSNLFPRELPAVPGLELAGRCLPARETGGDFYDVIKLGGRVGVIVGDVSGKSLPAAMLMAVARSTSRSEARNHETPWVVLNETNRWLVGDVPRNAFVALTYALIDPLSCTLVLGNGGQLTPLLRRADGSTVFVEAPPALPLGLKHDLEYGQVELELTPGDTLLFYTDGIVEAHDQCRQLFGFERLERLFQSWGHLPADELIDRILGEVHAFSAGMPTHDDMTLVVVRLTSE